MKKQYQNYDEDFKKTIVSLYELGKKYQNYQENMALVTLILEIGLISINLLQHLLVK